MDSSFFHCIYTNSLAPGLVPGKPLLEHVRGREMRSGTAGSWDSGSPFHF